MLSAGYKAVIVKASSQTLFGVGETDQTFWPRAA